MTAQLTHYIVMSTFNGDAYLDQQLESLRDQSFTNWKLLIRDDGSSDSTLDIIQQWCAKDPRFRLLKDEEGNLGPSKSFSRLLSQAVKENADIISFCDQDDVWKKDKLKISQDFFVNSDPKIPQLFFSDLILCDNKLKIINISYLSFMKFNPKTSSNELKHLLCQNIIVGCTMSINASLAKQALPIPDEALMHDWWLALVALCNEGIIHYEDKALINYRTHSKNVSGAGKNKSIFQFLLHFRAYQRLIDQRIQQAHALLSYAQEKHNTIIDFIEALTKGGILGLVKFLRQGFHYQGYQRQVAVLICILFRRFKFKQLQ